MQIHFLCVVIKIWVWTLWDLGIKAAITGYTLLTWGLWDTEITGEIINGRQPEDLLRNCSRLAVQLDPWGVWCLLAPFPMLLKIYWAISVPALSICHHVHRVLVEGLLLNFSQSHKACQPPLSLSVREEWK